MKAYEWATLPMPIGQIKSEPFAMETDASALDIYEEAEDNGISPSTSHNDIQIEILSNVFGDSSIEPQAGTSNGTAGTSNVHADTFTDS